MIWVCTVDRGGSEDTFNQWGFSPAAACSRDWTAVFTLWTSRRRTDSMCFESMAVAANYYLMGWEMSWKIAKENSASFSLTPPGTSLQLFPPWDPGKCTICSLVRNVEHREMTSFYSVCLFIEATTAEMQNVPKWSILCMGILSSGVRNLGHPDNDL